MSTCSIPGRTYPSTKAWPGFVLTTRRIPLSKIFDRLVLQFAHLSLSDRFSTHSAKWSRLERLPPELVMSIAEHLAFFDKKALASTSQRIYHLLGPLKPPDRFAWRVHILTSFNSVSSDQFDVTIFPPDEIRQELARIWRQIPAKPRFAHFNLDPTKSRLNDLSCLYFPTRFATKFRFGQIRCRTLGQFIAVQFSEYVHKVVKECDRGENLARKRRRLRNDADYRENHMADLYREIKQWQEIYGQCKNCVKSRYDGTSWVKVVAPNSAVEGSMEFMARMGYEMLCNRVCMYGRICELDEDEGIKIRRDSKIPPFAGWYALDEILVENADWSGDGMNEDKENEPPDPLEFWPEESHDSLLGWS